jgi:hypothetical protein
MDFVFPEEALAILRQTQFDPQAALGYELLSGGVTWSDEGLIEFAAVCRDKGCGYAGHALAYRTSLIEGKPRENLRFAWEELKTRCPEWIGFRPERTGPNPEVLAYLQRCREDDF